MSSLKALKNRIDSVQVTGKITNAARMIAVSNLKKTHQLILDAYPYLNEMTRILRRLVRSLSYSNTPLPPLIKGKESKHKYFIICVTSDQGLCGRFVHNVVAKTQQLIDFLLQENSYEIQLICFGSQGAEMLKKANPNLNVHVVQKQKNDKNSLYADAQNMAHGLVNAFYNNEFDTCTVVYSIFKSVAIQKIQIDQIIPFQTFQHENKFQFLMDSQDHAYMDQDVLGRKKFKHANARIFSAIGAKHFTALWGRADADAIAQESTRSPDSYDYMPSDVKLLDSLLLPFIEMHIYQILLNSIASENAARMMAMEGASKNATDMIKSLGKKYHRKRQELVTKDLTEVVSGMAV